MEHVLFLYIFLKPIEAFVQFSNSKANDPDGGARAVAGCLRPNADRARQTSALSTSGFSMR
jgi:hypothetical protein